MTTKRVKQTRRPKRTTSTKARNGRRSSRSTTTRQIDVHEVESLHKEIERLQKVGGPPRWNADPDDVRRSVVKLVLTLVEFIRQLLERQAIRRMEGGTLSDAETEAIGTALMRLEETIRDLCAQFDIPVDTLNLDLGPIGKLV
jgi:hypothetical protein